MTDQAEIIRCEQEIAHCRAEAINPNQPDQLGATRGEIDWMVAKQMAEEAHSYESFIQRKSQLGSTAGFTPNWMPEFLFDFQKALVEWQIVKGRAANLADCGLGKTPMELVWAENVARHTNKPVLIATPLAVSAQTIREGEKFEIACRRSSDGIVKAGDSIIITNYERLNKFDPDQFSGCVCDESSILKSFDGTRRKEITEFLRKLPYRLLCTATSAPNDYVELGTHAEALGELGYMDMLSRFFKNEQGNSTSTKRFHGESVKWRFKGHAEIPFYRWVCSWARATRRPSDLGFADGEFVLPPLIEQEYMVTANKLADGMLFALPAMSLPEQREERRRTLTERCEKVAELVAHNEQALVWCHLNDEGDLLERIIPGAKQVSGREKNDEAKEEKLMAFATGELRVLVTKPKIGAWGLNYQNCAHVVEFPSHSYEAHYQGVRRCWRFGQKRPVRNDIVTTEGEKAVLLNLQRKSRAAEQMFEHLVEEMNRALHIERAVEYQNKVEVPVWLS